MTTRSWVREAAAACASRGTISAEVTTSYAEVVRVDSVAVTEEPAAANCVRDRLWALEFPPGRRRVVEHFVTVER